MNMYFDFRFRILWEFLVPGSYGVSNMIVLVTLLCILSLHISQCVSFRYTTTSCLVTYKLDRTNMDKITCTGEHVVNHCIPDDQHKEMEVCVQWKWITPGYCPYYDKFSDVIKEVRCSFYCLWNEDLHDVCTCPSRLNDDSCDKKCKKDFGSDKYILCEPDKVSTTISPATHINSGGHGSRESSDSKINVSPTFSITSGRNGTESSPESQFSGSAMGITLGVILPFIILLLIVAGIHLFNKRRQTQGTSQRETAVERGEGDALMNTETKCLAENEQNQQLIEKDEGTSTEDKESSPLLAENKNENQSEGQLKENSMKNERISVSQNYDSPQKNESFETPLTSPAVQTEPDTDIGRTENKDDKKNEKKEGEGSREGRNSSEDVSPGVGAEEKKEEGSIERGHSPDVVSPDNGKEDDSHSSPVNDKNGDNGKQNTDVTEEDQIEEKGNEDQDVKLHVTDKSSNLSVKTDLNNEIESGCRMHADGSSGEQNSEQKDVSVDTTQNSDNQNDEGSGTSDNTAMKHVNEQEQEHQSNLNSSADSENTSDEIKDAVGIFVDSLESITREDDEEGGRSELQDLLEYMCTGPARKILFNVVKMYVDNPDSYFKDESKKALLKSALPPEFHSAHDFESEYRHSIPVMYAILHVSLSEKQPKSGWGQKVKDTDTGVGDDVERVYRAHTLSREIQNAENISVDGYVRLFEMLIGAVERLDIKGKCSEDYREIVKRWGNIQRKLWVKDKLTTFTNFIKKWS
ncbi:uncharacterized protein LOC125664393 isoform X2 [Ostrea edulis]|uniref:uncharacterized protein LOC125664393 isoform X2 n=1 Tax=Ostrea edulis TaxID=37623 RepID=UPI0024AF33F1|nr:uncharacterized protein LOC125664393 isoform X2 [Ostrea edulis]